MQEIEENNRMGKTRDLFKKIRDTKGTFHEMSTIKDRIGMDLTEAEDIKKWQEYTVQFSSIAQLCLTLFNHMNRSTPGLSVHHQVPEFTQTHVHQAGDGISHLILCRPLLLLPTIPPSIRVLSNESTLPMRWPKYWSFSFSIGPSHEGTIFSVMESVHGHPDLICLFTCSFVGSSLPAPFSRVSTVGLLGPGTL